MYEPSKTGAQKRLADKLRAENIVFLENQLLEGWEVDIFLSDYYLVVEVDGFYHLSVTQQEKDIVKNNTLQAAGYHVLRFTNTEIYQNTNKCVKKIKDLIENHKQKLKKAEQVETEKTPWQKKLAELQKALQDQETKSHGSKPWP